MPKTPRHYFAAAFLNDPAPACRADSFVSSAFLDKEGHELEAKNGASLGEMQRRADAGQGRTVVLYLRCITACVGSAVHNTGLWVLIDDSLFANLWRNCSWRGEAAPDALPCSTRSVLFIGFGYVVMLLLGSAAGNVGVSILTPTPAIQRSSSKLAETSPRRQGDGIEAPHAAEDESFSERTELPLTPLTPFNTQVEVVSPLPVAVVSDNPVTHEVSKSELVE